MPGKKLKKPGKEEQQLIVNKSSKRKLSKQNESSEAEENENTIVCKKKKLSPQGGKQRNVRRRRILNAGRNDKHNCEQSETDVKKTKISSNESQSSSAVPEIEENADAQLDYVPVTEFRGKETNGIVEHKFQKCHQVCHKSAESKTNVPDLEALHFMKCESVSSNDMFTDALSEQTFHDKSKVFEPIKKVAKKCESMSYQSSDDVQHTSLGKPKQNKVKLKNDILNKRVKREKNIKSNIINEADINLESVDNLNTTSEILLSNRLQNNRSKPCNNVFRSKKSGTQGGKKNSKLQRNLICSSGVDFYFESEESSSNENEHAQMTITSDKDMDYLPIVSERNFKSRNKQIKQKNVKVSKESQKSVSEMNETNEELTRSTNELLVELLQCAQSFMLQDKRDKLLSSDILHAQKCLLKKPLIYGSIYWENNSKVIDLSTLMQPEKYEVQRFSSNKTQTMNPDFSCLSACPQLLQKYFIAITKAIFHTDRHLFKYAVNDIRQNSSICHQQLFPLFYKLTVNGIEKYFTNRFYLERIFAVVISLIENDCLRKQNKHYVQRIIYSLLDYCIIQIPTSVPCVNNFWSSADLSADFLVRVMRKCETFSKEMYDSILLYLENLFQDTSKEFYSYYSALAILIALGPFAVFQAISKNFLPFCNHLSNYVKFEGIVENSVQHEALLVYGHLRSAIELLVKHCSNFNYFKSAHFIPFESSSLYDVNQNFHKETEKILNFLLSTNALQYFGDSLSSRFPLLTNCFVNDVPFSHFAVQLEKDSLSPRNTKQEISGYNGEILNCIKIISPNRNFPSHVTPTITYIKEKNMKPKFKNGHFRNIVNKRRLNHLKSGIGNLYLFL